MATRWKLSIAVAALLSLAASVAWGEVIGKTTLPLDGSRARIRESTLGDLVADAARAQMSADVALIPAGQLHPTTIPAGNLSQEELANLLFFPDEPVVLVRLSGSQIQAALERSLSFLPQPSVSFLQVSGLTVTYRRSAPAGHRVAEVQMGGAPLALQRWYRVALPDSLAEGSMGYFRAFSGVQRLQIGPSLSEALFRYVRASDAITIKPGARLRDLSPPAVER